MSLLMGMDLSSAAPDILLCSSGFGDCCWASREWRANLAASCRRAREGGRLSGGGIVGIDEEAGATVFVALGFCVYGLAYRLPFLCRGSVSRKKIMSIATKVIGVD